MDNLRDPSDNSRMQKFDSRIQAPVTVNVQESQIHAGNHYFAKTWGDLTGDGSILRFMFRTPTNGTKIHAKAGFGAEAEFTIEIYENPTVTDDGTEVTAYNNDRNSANTPELESFINPTISSDGTLLWAGKVGSNRQSTIAPGFNYEILAKTNEEYLFKITKVGTGTHWIDIDFWWFENEDE